MSLETIAETVYRVQFILQNVKELHDRGLASGDQSEMISESFHRSALDIYQRTFTTSYLRTVADLYGTTAHEMSRVRVSAGVSKSWTMIRAYVTSVYRVLSSLDPGRDGCCSEPISSSVSLPPTPSVLFDYAGLAERVSPAAVAQILESSRSVLLFCRAGRAERRRDIGLGAEQRVIVRRLARGDRILDIAIACGRSERSLYRDLKLVCEYLGVGNRSEAIAEAARRGWLEEETVCESPSKHQL